MRKKIIGIALLPVSAFFFYMSAGHSGYAYDKNDLTIPAGVTCQMQVKSWLSETGTVTMNAVVSGLDTVESDMTHSAADSLNANLNTLITTTGNFSQNMPPGCVPDLMFYEKAEAQVDDAIDYGGIGALSDLRHGKLASPAQEAIVQQAAARMRTVISNLDSIAR